MYTKLVAGNGGIGVYQAMLELSKSSARACAGYAIGQAYAGFDAELGAHIKFLGMNQKTTVPGSRLAAKDICFCDYINITSMRWLIFGKNSN